MSDQTQTPAPDAALQEKQAAAQLWLETQVIVPTFFNKLASFGIPTPSSTEEGDRYLRMGVKLLNAERLSVGKTASTRLSALEKAEADLDALLHEHYGVQPGNHQKQAEAAAVADAKALLQNQDVLNAVSTMLQ